MTNFPRACLLVFLLCLGQAHSAELEVTYTPTRAEWLKHSISQEIHQLSDAWSKRVAVLVLVIPKQNEVIVSVTFANGEGAPTHAAKARYVESVKGIAQSVLDRYSWSKDVKLSVQFV